MQEARIAGMANGSAATQRAPILYKATRISALRIVAFCLYAGIIVWVLRFGFRYASASQFMPYHREAVGIVWQEVPANTRVLLLGLIHLVGACILCLGWTLSFILCTSFRRAERWADWTVASALLIFTASGIWITHAVAAQTGAHTPWRTLGWVLIANLVATLICVLDQIRAGRRPTPASLSN